MKLNIINTCHVPIPKSGILSPVFKVAVCEKMDILLLLLLIFDHWSLRLGSNNTTHRKREGRKKKKARVKVWHLGLFPLPSVFWLGKKRKKIMKDFSLNIIFRKLHISCYNTLINIYVTHKRNFLSKFTWTSKKKCKFWKKNRLNTK